MNPFISYKNNSSSADITVNNITPNAQGQIDIPLYSLSDVHLTSVQNNETLQYSTALGKWINSTISAFSVALSQLVDCFINTPTDGQVLRYNSTLSKWVNATISYISTLAGLTDCTITNPSSNQVLQYNGSKWINATVSAGTTTLSGCTDTTISNPSDNQLLKYNGSKWVNATITTGTTTLSGCTDATITNPSSTQVLQYNGSKWANATLNIPTALRSMSDVDPSLSTRLAQDDILKYNGYFWTNVAFKLKELLDCNMSNVADGNVIMYSSASSKWINSTIPSVTTTLSGCTDATISNPSNNQLLKYNGSKWVNATVALTTALNALTDCTISNPSNNQILKYDGSKWVNSTAPSGTTTLSGCTDANISNPSSNQLLKYDGSKWVNATITIGTTTLAGCTDTALSNPSMGQFLKYNGSKWVNDLYYISLGMCSDTALSNPAKGNILRYNGSSWANSVNGVLSYCIYSFINISNFGGNQNYTLGSDYAYIYDQTNATPNSHLVLPTATGNGTFSFYLQTTGYQGSYMTDLVGGSGLIFTSPGNFAIAKALPLQTTYLFTYYANAGNPFESGYNYYPSWTMQSIGIIPMKPDTDLHLINTSGYNRVNGVLSLPPLVEGQSFRFVDIGGRLSYTPIVINGSNGVNVRGGGSSSFTTDSVKIMLCRVGNNCIQIQ